MTQREYDEAELEMLRRRLADVTAPSRQVPPTSAGREFRRLLLEDIARLERRLSEDE